MPRYFLEVAYKGTSYSGFQVQQNANSVQAEIERAFETLQRENVDLTGSSRTDAGVHALQNYFHFDFSGEIHPHFIYKMNSILPADLVVRNLVAVAGHAHCRFDAVSREYKYFLYAHKNPFLKDTAYYFPYKLNLELMQQAAELIKSYEDFTSFSKKNTQAKTFICNIMQSTWERKSDRVVYRVKADRFLRGMVRALVATMLQVGRGKITVEQFQKIIEGKDSSMASFAVPPHGLFLIRVEYPENYF